MTRGELTAACIRAELEEFGENEQAMGNNVAKRLIEEVRKRKGLLVEKKLVQHSDKQRTLKKNK